MRPRRNRGVSWWTFLCLRVCRTVWCVSACSAVGLAFSFCIPALENRVMSCFLDQSDMKLWSEHMGLCYRGVWHRLLLNILQSFFSFAPQIPNTVYPTFHLSTYCMLPPLHSACCDIFCLLFIYVVKKKRERGRESERIPQEWPSNQKGKLLLHLGVAFLLIGCSF